MIEEGRLLVDTGNIKIEGAEEEKQEKKLRRLVRGATFSGCEINL
jgi:hypothetical protein